MINLRPLALAAAALLTAVLSTTTPSVAGDYNGDFMVRLQGTYLLTDDKTDSITLNGAESRRTLAGHFLAESFGSAVQHIAFATDDIFATVEILKSIGFKTLAISPNYYDDLYARLGLDSDLLERLAANDILYDRDDFGEYFQVYSRNYGEGFFFEIIERKGGYDGYGAANAQFRIAAQKRQLRTKGMPRK